MLPARLTDVLLIDDSVIDLRLLTGLMTARQLRVSVALDGERGCRQAELLKPGLILLDVRMPGIDGFATCRRLKANNVTERTPVIFLSAATDLSERLLGFSVGAVDYITKPFHEQEVLARVAVHLQLRPQAAAPEDRASSPSPLLNEVLVIGAQKLLRESLSNPPSLDSLAAALGTNRRRLSEAFQAYCAMPVYGWLREERLRMAHDLVGHTDMPLAYIGEYLGYATPSGFAKAFLERYGCTASRLRREMQPR